MIVHLFIGPEGGSPDDPLLPLAFTSMSWIEVTTSAPVLIVSNGREREVR